MVFVEVATTGSVTVLIYVDDLHLNSTRAMHLLNFNNRLAVPVWLCKKEPKTLYL